MTALPPIPNKRVVGLKDGQIKLLRKLLLNPECSVPYCDKKTDDAHHVWPRSTITNDSWYVEITEDDGTKRVLPHVTGLCREHHQEVEIHESWIKYEDDQFVWYIKDEDDWFEIGPLVPQPGEVQHPKKKRAAKTAEPPDTQQVNLKAPADEMEVFLVLLDEAREMLGREKQNRSRWKFYTLFEVLTVFVRDAQRG